MIPIFRKIRKKMADDNKPIRYLRYAIGEILLVIIGILIALQINTWNKNRISNREEQIVLLNVHIEFLQNRESLKEAIATTDIGFNSSKIIFNLIGKEIIQINKHNFNNFF